ncbi:MAG: aldo/keto reductase [Nitrospinae bacterium]|nr:aldo/keto reductase [Nitrospinota bacterium]
MHSKKVEGLDIPWTALTLGGLQIAPSRDWGDECSEEEADKIVKTALECGIMAFDTAEAYGKGESERRLGKALGSRKNDVLIISKITPDAEMTVEGYMSRLERTLKNLGRDYVDSYLVHWPGFYVDSFGDMQRLCDVMAGLKESGKARTVGISNFLAKDIILMSEAAPVFTVNQVPYNLLHRLYEGEHLRECEKAGIGYMACSPTARGLLAGRLDGEALNAPARRDYHLYVPAAINNSQDMRDTVQEIADEINTAAINVALAWVIQQKNITTTVVGARRVDQVKEFCAAGEITLTPDQLERLNEESILFHGGSGTGIR